MFNISRLHYITQDNVFGYNHVQLIEEACMGGADWVQLRVKKTGYAEWKQVAEESLKVCRKYNAKLIINDNVRIAKEIGADGIHIGKEDMTPAAAREFLGKDYIIGATANTFIDIENLASEDINYIGLGPFRFTNTKEKLSPVLGIEGYQQILNACKEQAINFPIIGIGGIKKDDIKDLIGIGLHGVAISSAVNLANNKEEAMKEIVSTIKNILTYGSIGYSR